MCGTVRKTHKSRYIWICVAAACALCCLLIGLFIHSSLFRVLVLEGVLKGLQPETDANMAAVIFDTVHVQDREILSDGSDDLCRYVALYHDRVYYIAEEKPWEDEKQKTLALCSVDFSGENQRTHYVSQFTQEGIYSCPDLSGELYHKNPNLQYGSYCWDNKIILKDEMKVVEFDLETERVQEYKAEDYKLPKTDFNLSCRNGNVTLTNRHTGEEQTISFSTVADQNACAKKLMAVDGGFSASDAQLFYDYLVVENKIYLVSSAMNVFWTDMAFVFEYEPETSTALYVGCWDAGDSAGYSFTLIPAFE
ncbi:MAG: hypothetical protein ACI4GO_08260 [Hominenteromicrobium sp.]